MRRRVVLGLVVVIVAAAVTITVATATKPKPACGCSIEPNLRGPAEDAAVRFEAMALRGDATGAWSRLTDEARSRYGDVAGFQPVLDRLRAELREPDAGGWRAVADKLRRDRPSEVVVVHYATGAPRVVWPLLVRTPLGRIGEERIDPEPPALRMKATGDDDGVRVELPDGDLQRTSFVTIDGEGRDSLPRQVRVAEGVDRLTWSRPMRGPLVAIAIERSPAGFRVGSAAVTVD